MHPLTLAANFEGWKIFMGRKADPGFQKFSEKVFKRDGYTCQFCGFQARDYQEVVNLDQNYSNNKLSNLITACCFCAQCFFIESIGTGDFGGGTLIYLPEITQANVDSLCHVLFCAITNATRFSSSAESIFRSFKFRSQAIETQFGEGTSDPAIFGQLVLNAPNLTPEKMAEILKNIRLLPTRARFKTQIEHWAAAAMQELGTQAPPPTTSTQTENVE